MFVMVMLLKTSLCFSFVITLITRILDSFLFRPNMSLKITPCCSLKIALIYKNT